MQQIYHLRVSTDLNAIAQILAWLETYKPADITPKAWLEFQTALVEGFTNAVRHAHKNHSPVTPIDIELELAENFIAARVWDFGPAFDLNAKLAQISSEIDIENANGRGLSILKSVTDQLSYSVTDDNRNCLSILKYYTSSNSQ